MRKRFPLSLRHVSKIGCISENPNLFGFSFDLENFLTLKKANLFVFSSLNRNFAVSLQPNINKKEKQPQLSRRSLELQFKKTSQSDAPPTTFLPMPKNYVLHLQFFLVVSAATKHPTTPSASPPIPTGTAWTATRSDQYLFREPRQLHPGSRCCKRNYHLKI